MAIARGLILQDDLAKKKQFRRQVTKVTIDEIESPPHSDDEEGQARMKEKKKRCLLAGANRLRREFAEFREMKRNGLLNIQQLPSQSSPISKPIQAAQNEFAFEKLASTKAADDHSHEEVFLLLEFLVQH